jgi:hypothetical protein
LLQKMSGPGKNVQQRSFHLVNIQYFHYYYYYCN